MQKKPRIPVHAIFAIVLIAIGASGPTQAQQYPSKPIKFIVAGAAGTSLDGTARFFAERMATSLHAQVIVDDRAGAGGLIATDSVAKAPADGYSVLLQGVPIYTYRWLAEAPIPFDPIGDFTPLARVVSVPLAFVVPANSPYKTLSDLISAMKARPNQITYSTGGSGSTPHLCTVALMELTHTSAKHIPYKGNSPAVGDVAGGQVDFSCQSPAIVGLVKESRLRALAVTNRTRWESLPNVPTTHEAGVSGFDFSGWSGMFLRSGTAPGIVQMLSDEIVRIAKTPEFKEFSEKNTMDVDIRDYKAFSAEVPKNEALWKRLAQQAKNS